MIPVTQKASNTCTYCRIRKQRCDRELPSCSRCSVKLRPCDYTWIKDAPNYTEPLVAHTGPLFVPRGSCCSDLSLRGRDELLQATAAGTHREPGSASTLSELVTDVLDQAGTFVSAIMEEYAPSVHQWCPLANEDMLRNGWNGSFDNAPSDAPVKRMVVLRMVGASERESGVNRREAGA
ncbi:hypothetical protein K458DRAFT_404797 [Lentithecium fluviatile CBS 122367]|uniref:Zn(2)-C6 fungal-type domain-containing protein n=1 Tax=Lentithecium fluviatile CBS 122367 TaxID=1168545 RepID=A0A6G1J109_9PLEO|nr:hypothetical protein K458DRAFT_404797 [Lentithecium fluviatile CBS 122367]